MSEEQNIHDLIDRYLKGELDRDELDRFRNRLRSEQDFAREVELHRTLVEEITDARKRELKSYLKENAKVEYIGNIWGAKWLYASAAIIVVMVGMFFLTKQLQTDEGIVQKEQTEDQVTTEQERAHYKPAPESELADSLAEDSVDIRFAFGVVAEDEEVESERMMNDNAASKEFASEYSEMSENERKLEADEIQDSLVRADKLVSSSSYAVVVIRSANKVNAYLKNADKVAVTETTIADEELKEKKKKGIFGRSKDDADAEPSSEDDYDVSTESRTISSRQIDVEFWSSPVNFKGYKYDRSVLLLYGVAPTESISFTEYQGVLYMSRNGQYYTITPASNFVKFTKLTNSSVIKELNR